MTTARDLFQKVIDLLPGRWISGQYHHDALDRHCAVGLVDLAAVQLGLSQGTPIQESAGDIALFALRNMPGAKVALNRALQIRGKGWDEIKLDYISIDQITEQIINYNDTEGRTEAEVLDFFKDVYVETPLD